MRKEQKLKKAIKDVFDQFDYANYVGKQVGDFKRGLTTGELECLKRMCFNDWLVEKGIVDVVDFEEWQKKGER